MLAPVAFAALAGLVSGCEVGAHDDAPAHGPALHVVATYPSNGQGTNAADGASVDCDSPTPDCPVPTDVAIELRFDRFLLPGGGLAAGLSLSSGGSSVALSPEYDLIERVVVFRSGQALQPNTLYVAQILPSTNPSQGFWAFDGAPLEEAAVPLTFSFSTGSGPSSGAAAAAAAAPSAPDTCDTMTEGPLATCAHCHTTQPGPETIPPSKYPPMGLDLSSALGLYYTAVAHVAHQTETGNTAADIGLESPARFGVQMNVVDPGEPGTSYLMYKLLEKPDNYQLDASEPSCVTGYHAPVSDGNCQPPSADELAQLGAWFVLGDPMPKAGSDGATAAISHASLRRIAAWIGAGAACSP
jgi:hypothetical protein